MNDSIEYEILNWESREVWRCQGSCKKYRHRSTVKGILPAVCCGVPAKLIDRYRQPVAFTVSEQLPPSEATETPDEVLESVMAQMQAAALLSPEPTQEPGKGDHKS